MTTESQRRVTSYLADIEKEFSGIPNMLPYDSFEDQVAASAEGMQIYQTWMMNHLITNDYPLSAQERELRRALAQAEYAQKKIAEILKSGQQLLDKSLFDHIVIRLNKIDRISLNANGNIDVQSSRKMARQLQQRVDDAIKYKKSLMQVSTLWPRKTRLDSPEERAARHRRERDKQARFSWNDISTYWFCWR